MPLASTGAFVEVLEAVRAAEPVQIDHPWVTWEGEGPTRRPLVADVEAIVDRAADRLALFSEVGAPWRTRRTTTCSRRSGSTVPRVATVLDGSGTIPTSSPRPYLHPVRTRGGVTVSAHHPGDHDWHCGVGFAIPDLDGVNCWGGRTYVHGDGYVWRDDHGRVDVVHAEQRPGWLGQELVWRGPDGGVVLHEDRVLTWAGRRTAGRSTGRRRSVRRAPPPSGSAAPGRTGASVPGTAASSGGSRPAARVSVRTADAVGEDAVHGSVAPWVEWAADFDGRPATVRVTALDHHDPWFVRVAEYPAIGSALAWRSPVTVRPDVPLCGRSGRRCATGGDLAARYGRDMRATVVT